MNSTILHASFFLQISKKNTGIEKNKMQANGLMCTTSFGKGHNNFCTPGNEEKQPPPQKKRPNPHASTSILALRCVVTSVVFDSVVTSDWTEFIESFSCNFFLRFFGVARPKIRKVYKMILSLSCLVTLSYSLSRSIK